MTEETKIILQKMEELQSEIVGVKTELRTELKSEIADVKSELKSEIKSEIAKSEERTKKYVDARIAKSESLLLDEFERVWSQITQVKQRVQSGF